MDQWIQREFRANLIATWICAGSSGKIVDGSVVKREVFQERCPRKHRILESSCVHEECGSEETGPERQEQLPEVPSTRGKHAMNRNTTRAKLG